MDDSSDDTHSDEFDLIEYDRYYREIRGMLLETAGERAWYDGPNIRSPSMVPECVRRRKAGVLKLERRFGRKIKALILQCERKKRREC